MTTSRTFIVAATLAGILSANAASAETMKPLHAISIDVGSKHGVGYEIVVFNAAQRYRDILTDLDPYRVANAVRTGAFGGFLVGQCAARAMLPRGRGSIFLTGATASVKGVAQSAPFAMQKFALRGLAQSMARELHPRGIHVAPIIIDGRIGSPGDTGSSTLDPDAIAMAYLGLHRQDKSVWSAEIDLRPFTEAF
jgi:NAD(P)-dependent dehydrogenase (short-subunit alcohol dehydrogenase family)